MSDFNEVSASCFCMECLEFFEVSLTSEELRDVRQGRSKVLCPVVDTVDMSRSGLVSMEHQVSVVGVRRKDYRRDK